MQAQQQARFSRQLVYRQTTLRFYCSCRPFLLHLRQFMGWEVDSIFMMIIQYDSCDGIIIVIVEMIANLKVKIRSTKEDTTRRIRTETNENSKKISLYTNAKPKVPLAENRKLNNESQTLNLKKQRPIKSIALKQSSSKLNTQAKDRQILSQAHRVAIDKIFGNKRDQPSLSMNKKDREDKEVKESSRMIGAARYMFEDKVGNGTFGIVHKARDKKTLQTVAIKRVFQDKKYKNRELQILKTLNHPNVLKIRDSFYTYEGEKEYLNVVMDYFPSNLYQSLQKYKNKGQMSRIKLKVLAYQMFRGLLYLTSIDISHRDMKPQNILVNDNNWKLLICDFGSAKKLAPGQPNLAYICSRCYRAPQLIFGCTNYTTKIDMWSAGCILIQMVYLQPIFRGDSNIDQLVEIIKILGTPTYQEIMQMNPDCDLDKYQFPKISARLWQKVLKKKQFGEEFYDLLNKVMKYSPAKRITPEEALLHPFFDQLRSQDVYTKLRKQYQIPDLFDFKMTREISDSNLKHLVPKWYNRQI